MTEGERDKTERAMRKTKIQWKNGKMELLFFVDCKIALGNDKPSTCTFDRSKK